MPSIAATLQKAISVIDRLDAEVILALVLGRTREYLSAHSEQSLEPQTTRRFHTLVAKRKTGVPLAYLTGHKKFYGLDFFVNRSTLIPRGETELLVELVGDRLQKETEPIALVDIGAGTGCIPIAIIKTLKHKNIKTLSSAMATDISAPALRVAKKNAKFHGVNVTLCRGDLLDPIFKRKRLLQKCSRLIITANLPYLTRTQYESAPSIQHEPCRALVAEDEGLALYKKLLKQISILTTSGQFADPHLDAYLEIDPAQVPALSRQIHAIFPSANVSIHKDLAGRNRLIHIRIHSHSTS
ncbi:MAG: peptide chain release factor N(5)-glutamine methyltransferase [Candidatus Magasanikbacteria bacterium]|nr:peptide chain release factor N(5)-glutamine methyltransferase [Candidatus Magasanikbacteria bacterium]